MNTVTQPGIDRFCLHLVHMDPFSQPHHALSRERTLTSRAGDRKRQCISLISTFSAIYFVTVWNSPHGAKTV